MPSSLNSSKHVPVARTNCCASGAEQAWRLPWGSLLACTAARAVATSLLEHPCARGSDGSTPPSHEVELDF